MKKVRLIPLLAIRFLGLYIKRKHFSSATGSPKHSIKWLGAQIPLVRRVLSLRRILVTDLVSFARTLTGAESTEIGDYINEIRLNREFNNHIWGKVSQFKNILGDKAFSAGTIGEEEGVLLYAVVRQLKPDIVLETGPGSGVSSAYILCALSKNDKGKLLSIDLPPEHGQTYAEGYLVPIGGKTPLPEGERQGWVIPNELRHRWELVPGRSSEKLATCLKQLEFIDIFFHDSEHSYENMKQEYQTVWPNLKSRKVLLSHDIMWNNAFLEFAKTVKGKATVFLGKGGSIGGIAKL